LIAVSKNYIKLGPPVKPQDDKCFYDQPGNWINNKTIKTIKDNIASIKEILDAFFGFLLNHGSHVLWQTRAPMKKTMVRIKNKTKMVSRIMLLSYIFDKWIVASGSRIVKQRKGSFCMLGKLSCSKSM